MKNSIASFTIIASSIRKLSFSLLITGCWLTASLAETTKVEIVGTPEVYGDRVTARIKVKGDEDKPLIGLNETDFKLYVDDREVDFQSKDWQSPEEATPPPVWVVVLLDMSGSMKTADSSGTTKLQGAVNAIEKFTDLAAKRAGSTQISIVPFGEAGRGCAGYSVDESTLDKFLAGNDFKLQKRLDNLAKSVPCASTDLYEPISDAIKFLGNTNDPRFYLPEGKKGLEPRLSIILLSDGYHNKPDEERDFEILTRQFQLNKNIIVHTLGYGLTPEELGDRYGLGRAATREDINNPVPAEEFVDRERLADIAKLTGGIGEFSGDAPEIAQNLQLFLNALLGEYQITYTEPNPERGAKRNLQVAVESPQDSSPVISQPKPYTVTVFGRSLPRITRLWILGGTLGGMVLGILIFWSWANKLKQEAMDN